MFVYNLHKNKCVHWHGSSTAHDKWDNSTISFTLVSTRTEIISKVLPQLYSMNLIVSIIWCINYYYQVYLVYLLFTNQWNEQ